MGFVRHELLVIATMFGIIMIVVIAGTSVNCIRQSTVLRETWERERLWPRGLFKKFVARYGSATHQSFLCALHPTAACKAQQRRMYLSFLYIVAAIAGTIACFALASWLRQA